MKKLLPILFFSIAATFTQAANFIVSNTNSSGVGSLPQAIADANAAGSGPHFIDASGLTGTITVSSTLNISESMTISAPTAGGLIISGNNAIQLFTMASGKTITLNYLTIQDALYTSGGGAILNSGASLTIYKCTFYNNEVSGSAQGGAIGNFSGGVLIADNSTFYNNATSNNGGAIVNYGVCAFTNCTFYNNTGGSGAAIANYGTAALINCTLANNSGSTSALFNGNANPNTLTLKNTIVTESSEGIINSDNSLFEDVSAATLSGSGNITGNTYTDIFGSNVLSDNGGITKTVAILNPGPAIDAGATGAGIPTNDQLDQSRVNNPDIGSFESQGPTNTLDEIITNETNVYSNPSEGIFFLDISEKISGTVEWKIINASGNIILQEKVNKGNILKTFSLDLTKYASGTYFLIINSGKSSASKELIKY